MQQRSELGQYLVGLSDMDDLSTRGYTRLIDSPDVSMGVDWLAGIISNATIQLIKNTPDGDVRVKNELSKFLDISPYSLGTRKTLIAWIVSYMLTEGRGNACVLPVTSGGLLQDLVPMPGAIPVCLDGSDMNYVIEWKGRRLDPQNVLHFVYHPDLLHPWRGRGIEVPLRDVLKNLRQAAITTNGFMSSEWKPSLIVKVDAMADEFADPAGRRQLLDEYVANQKAGEPWVIPGELIDVKDVKPLSLADLAIADNVELDKRSVAGMIGVPPFAVGVGSYNQAEYNAAIRTTAKNIVTVIQTEMTKKLIISPDMYVRMNEWKLCNYEVKDLATVGCDLYIRGIASGNEVRDLIGWSSVKGLDERVILENYIPAGMIGDQKKLNQNGGKSDE
jgi:HK97 family phage portal protein